MDSLRERLAAIEEAYGPWTAHDIQLAANVSTMGRGLQQQWRVDWFRYQFERHASKPLVESRILDLACLEGLFAIEFARLGASTVGVEIRDAHLAKCQFAKEEIALDNVQFVKSDVRSMPPLGRFDIVICAGILYHLDFPDNIRFIESICRLADDLVIVDSHLAYEHITVSVLPLSEMLSFDDNGAQYSGRIMIEHAAHVSENEMANQHPWASIDNVRSVWLGERDVVGLFARMGFALKERSYPSPEYEAANPDRPTLVFKRSA